MTVVEILDEARTGAAVERLVCHPRLPLVAGLDSVRPGVRVWECAGGRLREVGETGVGSEPYGGAFGWERLLRTPVPAWHPERAELVVSAEGKVVRWTPAGVEDAVRVPDGARYRNLAFAPDGRTLWGSPSTRAEERCDVIDPGTGAVTVGPWWDTGVAAHPGGGLLLTLSSDQGATHGLFTRATGPGPRLLHRAVILDCDGYETPLFSPDGRHFAVRGNAYGNSVDVFAFPSLERVLSTPLGEPSPGYPYPPEWLESMRAWSRHNLAFGADPGLLWVGTPRGTLVALDVETREAEEHPLLDGSRVTALATTATGEFVVAGSGGELALLSVPAGRTAEPGTAKTAVTAFLDSTHDIPVDDDLEEHLLLTDGVRTWSADDLDTIDTADDTDPTWLRIQATVNSLRDQERRE
ncbi:hypothetical protein Stsp02_05160 [Streptomyces sp. NBRC 14336]|uniref:hypothetical protein n=1 Tax=Streptomyces sp. NBRC 14336 TaxID=3030992 RepID=UPI0024A37C30|nr:hypothetical protein [Streptomyces sp. NBRC 14336]GLW44854.1 hypothetical protein Stsp02_05160 [Streptomyces sp. NBRC 14336]